MPCRALCAVLLVTSPVDVCAAPPGFHELLDLCRPLGLVFGAVLLVGLGRLLAHAPGVDLGRVTNPLADASAAHDAPPEPSNCCTSASGQCSVRAHAQTMASRT